MALAAVISLTISGVKFGLPIFSSPSCYFTAALAVAVYALGFCSRDRITALTSSLLMAVSISFTLQSPPDTTFTLMALLALTAYAGQKPLAGLIIAGLATAARIDGILLGLLLIYIVLSEKTMRPAVALPAFVGSTIAGVLGLFAVKHHLPPMPQWHPNASAPTFFFTGGAAIIGWLVFPFLADLAEPARLSRWKPLAAWTSISMLLSCFVQHIYSVPFLTVEPFMIVLAAAGFARVLPVIASDAVRPRVRYILAIAAAVALAIPKAHLDWTTTQPAILVLQAPGETSKPETKAVEPSGKPETPSTHTTASKPAHNNTAPAAGIPKHVVAVHVPDPKRAGTPPTPAAGTPAAIVAEAVKLGVPVTHKDWRGRVLPRNVWAIQWDIKNKQAALAAKGAPHKQ